MDNRKGLYSLTKVRTQMTNQELKEAMMALLTETKGKPTPDQMAELYVKAANDEFIEVCEEARAEYASKRNIFDQVKDSVDNVLQSDKAQEVKEKAKSLLNQVKTGTKETVEKLKEQDTGLYTAVYARKLTEQSRIDKLKQQILEATAKGKTSITIPDGEMTNSIHKAITDKGYLIERQDRNYLIYW